MAKAYTLGRGKLFFKRSTDPGYRDVGNVTEFRIALEKDVLEHFSTASGIKVKDAEVVRELKANVGFTVDEITKENLLNFVLGTETPNSPTGGNITDEPVNGAAQGYWFKLQHRELVSGTVVVTDSTGATTYSEGTDYEVDYAGGAIYIVPGGNITNGTDLLVDYSYNAYQADELAVAQSTQVSGSLWFKADPPVGSVIDVMGDVDLAPAGELGLITEEWMNLGFEGALKNGKLIYRGVR